MRYIYIVLISYLIGSISPSYIIGRLKGFDIRKRGSGNAGGSNAVVTMGKGIGILCILIDIIKGYVLTKLMVYYFPMRYSFEVSSGMLVAGHIFPFYMKFRGGKGFATLVGILISYSPMVFLVMAVIEIPLALALDYICVIPITAAIAFPIIYRTLGGSGIGTLILCIIPILIVERHIENLRRIHDGAELHISYLWNKERELERVTANRDERAGK